MLRYENEIDKDFAKRLIAKIRPIIEEAAKKHLIVSTKDEFVEYVLKVLEKILERERKMIDKKTFFKC